MDLRSAPIRAQLALGIGALIALAAAVIAVAIVSVGALERGQDDMSGHAVPYLTGLSDAAVAAKAAANDERGFLLTGDKKYADEARGRRDVEQAGLTQARAAASESAQATAVDRVRTELDAFNSSLDDEFTLVATNRAAALAISTGRNRDLRKAYEATFDEAISLAKKHVATVALNDRREAQRSRATQFTLLGVMVAAGAVLIWLLGRALARPLSAGVAALEAAAAGNMTVRVPAGGAREFRRLADATNRMLTATGQTVGVIATNATTLRDTADQLAATSGRLAGAAEGAARQAEQVSTAAGHVSTSVQAVAAAAEEMGSSIHEIAGSATSAAQVATEAVTAADAARATVTKLDDSSSQIGVVVKTITTIAEQTNLLALNATIEAARAGNAGKGFAVVASEVKDLAQETARATEDIAQRVEAIQTDTRHAIDAIARIASVIGQINDHQSVIAGTVEEQATTTQEMARSITEAASSATSIANNITAVAAATRETTEGTDQATRVAAALAGMGTELTELAGRFQV